MRVSCHIGPGCNSLSLLLVLVRGSGSLGASSGLDPGCWGQRCYHVHVLPVALGSRVCASTSVGSLARGAVSGAPVAPDTVCQRNEINPGCVI